MLNPHGGEAGQGLHVEESRAISSVSIGELLSGVRCLLRTAESRRPWGRSGRRKDCTGPSPRAPWLINLMSEHLLKKFMSKWRPSRRPALVFTFWVRSRHVRTREPSSWLCGDMEVDLALTPGAAKRYNRITDWGRLLYIDWRM